MLLVLSALRLRVSEYRSFLLCHVLQIISTSSRSEAPSLIGPLRSVPFVPNRQVYKLPSGERRSLVHAPQNGFVTEEIMPISPGPFVNIHYDFPQITWLHRRFP